MRRKKLSFGAVAAAVMAIFLGFSGCSSNNPVSPDANGTLGSNAGQPMNSAVPDIRTFTRGGQESDEPTIDSDFLEADALEGEALRKSTSEIGRFSRGSEGSSDEPTADSDFLQADFLLKSGIGQYSRGSEGSSDEPVDDHHFLSADIVD
jgi:hypothetical protein